MPGDRAGQLDDPVGERTDVDHRGRQGTRLDIGQGVDVVDQTRKAVQLGDAEVAGLGHVVRIGRSIISRWPRTIVMGVLSSCRTSSSSCRCASTDIARRSSMELTEVVRSEISSLPWARRARAEVVDGDGVGRVAQAPQRREQATGDEPAGHAHQHQHAEGRGGVGHRRQAHQLHPLVDRDHLDDRTPRGGDGGEQDRTVHAVETSRRSALRDGGGQGADQAAVVRE